MADFRVNRIHRRGLVWQVPLQFHKFGLDSVVLGAFQPDLVPVDSAFGSWGGTNGIKHVFCWVFVLATRPSTVPFKVADQGFRVGADFAEVDLLSTLGEQQETVELREKLGRGLMDSAENGLAVVGKLLQELHNRP